jgi:hypothetical protein
MTRSATGSPLADPTVGAVGADSGRPTRSREEMSDPERTAQPRNAVPLLETLPLGLAERGDEMTTRTRTLTRALLALAAPGRLLSTHAAAGAPSAGSDTSGDTVIESKDQPGYRAIRLFATACKGWLPSPSDLAGSALIAATSQVAAFGLTARRASGPR